MFSLRNPLAQGFLVALFLFKEPKNRRFPVNFPVSRELGLGDRFFSDCIRHHPVLRNLDIKTCKHEGGFCGHFSRVVVSDFRSLHGDIVIRSLFARLSPATKIPFQTRIGRADRKSYAIGTGAFSAVLMRWGLGIACRARL